LNNTPKPNEAGIFAGVIATQEFALGLSQLGTDGSNPSPAIGESGAKPYSLAEGRSAIGARDGKEDELDGAGRKDLPVPELLMMLRQSQATLSARS
jgi:hypothetical protein